MMEKKVNAPDIVFIMGIMPRSGTHFLANLLCHHPDCERSVIPEDGLVSRSAFLTSYANRNYKRWQIEGGLPEIPAKELLLESLGEGLLTFLRRAREETLVRESPTEVFPEPRYLVAKSPQVIGIENFFRLFPNQKLLIIVRDGRALVESIHTSFRYNREEATRDWAESTAIISKFVQMRETAEGRYLIVKYEDLCTHTEHEVRKILAFLELDSNKYDFKAALELPVVGSSVFKRGEGEVHWKPVDKTEEFNPLARAANWTRKQHERFNWLAKDQLIHWGYTPKQFANYKIIWNLWNQFHDFKTGIKTWFRRFIKLLIIIYTRLNNHLTRK